MLNYNTVGLFHLFDGVLEILAVVDCIAAAANHDVDYIVIGKLRIHRDSGDLACDNRKIASDPIVAVLAEYSYLLASETELVEILAKTGEIIINLSKCLALNLAFKIVKSILGLVCTLFTAENNDVLNRIHIRKIGILYFFLQYVQLLTA